MRRQTRIVVHMHRLILCDRSDITGLDRMPGRRALHTVKVTHVNCSRCRSHAIEDIQMRSCGSKAQRSSLTSEQSVIGVRVIDSADSQKQSSVTTDSISR